MHRCSFESVWCHSVFLGPDLRRLSGSRPRRCMGALAKLSVYRMHLRKQQLLFQALVHSYVVHEHRFEVHIIFLQGFSARLVHALARVTPGAAKMGDMHASAWAGIHAHMSFHTCACSERVGCACLRYTCSKVRVCVCVRVVQVRALRLSTSESRG